MQDPLVGTTLTGKYQILSVVGHGGMGVVYKARDELMDRLVAIKMLKAQLISDSMSVKRFHQEGKAASRINHPHVITVHEFGISPSGQPFIVMDFLEGISLAQVIKDDGQVSVERTVKILIQACDALSHAHRHGVVHRDLKPSNIVLVDYDGQKDFVKVVDFGVAKLITGANQDLQRLTQAGEVCGSPVYMSPEQCQGEELDARSDIYSMGVVIYESLTGQLPFIGQTMVETMSKHITEKAPPFTEARSDLYIPERLESVVFKALSKDPGQRQESMALLKHDLETSIPRPGRSQVLRSEPEETNARTSGSFDAQKPATKFPVFKLAVAVSLVFLIAVPVMLALGMGPAIQNFVSPRKTEIEKLPAPGQSESATPAQTPAKDGASTVQGSAIPNQTTPGSSTSGSSINEKLQHDSAQGILTAPDLAAPKSDHDANPVKVQPQKAATVNETRTAPEQRSRVSMIAPFRRKAYSAAAAGSYNQPDKEIKAVNAKRIAHRHNKSGSEAPASRIKDPFLDLDKSHSYVQDWKESK
jgi:serine/threonine-protein kinase